MDSLPDIYDELKTLEALIEKSGNHIRSLAIVAANKRAEYEELKNKCLIEMFAEEAKQNFKRTEAQRCAIYRSMYSTQRLMWQLADNELSAERDYLKALLGNQISTEVRRGLVESDLRMALHAV